MTQTPQNQSIAVFPLSISMPQKLARKALFKIFSNVRFGFLTIVENGEVVGRLDRKSVV